MSLPMVWWVVLGKIGAAIGIGATKLAVLTAAAFKAAAIGTAFAVKGIVFTKTGAITMTVAMGASTYLEATDATVDAIAEFGYKSDTSSSIPMIKQDINIIIADQGIYTVRYCEIGNEKVIIPTSYKMCPHDGSSPKSGHSFEFID